MRETLIHYTNKKRKKIQLDKRETIIINYLLNLKGKRFFIGRIAKETGLAKQTIYTKLERLQKARVISSKWELNPFALGFKIVEVDSSIAKSKESKIIDALKKHPAITNARKIINDNLRFDVVIRDIDDYKEIEKKLIELGMKIIDFKIIIERVSKE